MTDCERSCPARITDLETGAYIGCGVNETCPRIALLEYKAQMSAEYDCPVKERDYWRKRAEQAEARAALKHRIGPDGAWEETTALEQAETTMDSHAAFGGDSYMMQMQDGRTAQECVPPLRVSKEKK